MRQGIQVSLLWPLMNAVYRNLTSRICSLCGYKKIVGGGAQSDRTLSAMAAVQSFHSKHDFCLLSEAWFKGGGGGRAYTRDPCC